MTQVKITELAGSENELINLPPNGKYYKFELLDGDGKIVTRSFVREKQTCWRIEEFSTIDKKDENKGYGSELLNAICCYIINFNDEKVIRVHPSYLEFREWFKKRGFGYEDAKELCYTG